MRTTTEGEGRARLSADDRSVWRDALNVSAGQGHGEPCSIYAPIRDCGVAGPEVFISPSQSFELVAPLIEQPATVVDHLHPTVRRKASGWEIRMEAGKAFGPTRWYLAIVLDDGRPLFSVRISVTSSTTGNTGTSGNRVGGRG